MALTRLHTGDASPEVKRLRLDTTLYEVPETPAIGSAIPRVGQHAKAEEELKTLRAEVAAMKKEGERMKRRMGELELQVGSERLAKDLARADMDARLSKARNDHEGELRLLELRLTEANNSLGIRVAEVAQQADTIRGLREQFARLEGQLRQAATDRQAAAEEAKRMATEHAAALAEEKRKAAEQQSVLMQSLEMQSSKSRILAAGQQSMTQEIAAQRTAMMSAERWAALETDYKRKVHGLEEEVKRLSAQGGSQDDKKHIALLQNQLRGYDDLKARMAEIEKDSRDIMTLGRERIELHEKIRGLEARLSAVDQLQREHVSLQVKCANLEKGQSAVRVADLERNIARLEQERLVLADRLAEATRGNAGRDRRLMDMAAALQQAVRGLETAKGQATVGEEDRKALQRKMAFYEADRDSFKRYLEHFLDDRTTDAAKNQIAALTESNDRQMQQLQAKEAELLGLREALGKAQAERDGANALLQPLTAMLSAAKAIVDGIPNAMASAEGQQQQETNRQLAAEVARLKEELKKAIAATPLGYDPTKTKVISPVESPLVMHLREELNSVREELAKKAAGQDTSAEVLELKKQIKKNDKAFRMMQEAFKKRYDTLRECYLHLFGYRLDIGANDEMRLRSIYAERTEEGQLAFHVENGQVTLMDSDYFHALPAPLKEHVSGPNGSIPAFLSNLTLHLFKNR